MRKKAAEKDGLDGRLRELEERVVLFEHEAVSGAHLISQLEATLRVVEQARRKLEAVVSRQNEELKKRRLEASELKRRFEQETRERIRQAQEVVRAEMAAEMKRVMDCAEAVRREGIEAFEEARALNKPRPPAPVPPGLD